MKTISITWKNSQKALRASSTFLKVGTFVGLNLAGDVSITGANVRLTGALIYLN